MSDNLTRVTVLICSVAGLATVTAVATFLISLQSGLARREAMVLRLYAAASWDCHPRNLCARSGCRAAWRVFEPWEHWAAEVAISHGAFPILTFFRSNDSRCEWLAALGAVLDAAALLDSSVQNAPAQARAGAHFVLRTGTRLVTDIAQQFRVEPPSDFDVANAQRFTEHRRPLTDVGYELVEDSEQAFRRFIERRQAYAPALGALARRLQIIVDERGPHDRDSAPIGN